MIDIIVFVLDSLWKAFNALDQVYILPNLTLAWTFVGMSVLGIFIGYWKRGITNDRN